MRKSIGLKIMVPFCILAIVCGLCSTLIYSKIAQMNRALDMLKFKCWYYEQAAHDGSEDRIKALIPDRLPHGIREAYQNTHQEST